MTNTRPVWFVTGCSTGFGYELARQLIARGDRAVVTARDKTKLADLVAGHETTAFALDLDVTRPEQVEASVKAALERFGQIDVLVNNAGYGYMATIEEGDETEIRKQFDANVFGLFAVTRAVLPAMRQQRRGRIINISSVAGLVGFPGSGYYAASKHAVEGWSDSLAAEVKPLGIQVTCVEPGPFRTDWAGRSLTQTPNRIADYAETAGVRLANTKKQSGQQAGDPARAALALIRISEVETAPRHLVLGAFGVNAVTQKLKERLAEIEAGRELGLSTDFPAS
jgi:NAD(P)-dependent dehydrogenase (short-subunit alcohol dehydrogenase family)